MSAHWRLALGGAAATAVMSLGAAAAVGYYFGAVYAGAFLYGAGVGLVSFTSIALTAWLLGGKLSGERVLLGVGVYFGRLVFAVVAVGAPIIMEDDECFGHDVTSRSSRPRTTSAMSNRRPGELRDDPP